MRRSRLMSTLTSAAIAAVLSLGTLGLSAPAALAAPAHGTPGSTQNATSSRQALAVLHRAQAAFGVGASKANPAPFSISGDAAGRTHPIDGTMTLVELSRVLPQLRGADRAAAKGLLARPTDGGFADPIQWRPSELAAGHAECGPHVCVNYTSDNRYGNAPDPSIDSLSIDPASGALLSRANGVPDQVDQTVATFEHVWVVETTTMGYAEPKSDGGVAEPWTPSGDEDHFDVYLADIGQRSIGYYGYCVGEQPNRRVSSGYCVVDNDFSRSEFGTANSPINNLRVTAAHEFFHAIQFNYDSWEDRWFMESTAAWMEDEVYPRINDNLQYLKYGPMHRPGQPIDFISISGLTSYGSWVFFRYLSNQYGPDIVKTAWTDAIGGAMYSLKALSAALEAHHTDFATQFAGFEAANAAPASFYDADGRRYANYAATPANVVGLSAAHPTSGWLRSPKVKHASAFRIAAAPKSASGHLRVEVRGPGTKTAPRVELVVHLRNGEATRRAITLVHGAGSVRGLAFGKRTVGRIDVILVNASTRFSCHTGTYYACNGYPTDDDSVFQVRVTRTA